MDQQQSMWGQGSIMAHRRRDKSAEASTESTDDMSEDENLFDFIGRELDQREEEAMRLEQQQQQQQKDNNGNNGNINDNQTQVGSVGYSQSSDNKVVDFTTMNDDYLSVADGINDSPHDETKHDASNNHDDNHVADKAIPIPRTTSKRRREYSVVKSTTPRFSFQSATKSAAATASNNKKSPMMEVVQHSVTSPLTATQSENQSRKLSKQRRMHRHSFRQSLDRNNTSINNGSAAVMTQVNNNMRELAFVPKFLANSRAAAGCANDAISSQLENNNDDDGNDNNDAERKWGPMSSTLTASPHKQSNSGSNSRRSKAGGYLIQNLRSLRNNDQWMAMRLRVSMGGSSSALMSRKRRRSSAGAAGSGGGGAVGNLDPKQVATSQLDVTVMGATDGGSSVSNNQNESSIRLAYIHRYTASAAAVNNLTTPCYSWIVLPQSVIHEQSVSVGEGNVVGGSMLLQFRCYDAIVIHPRIAHVDTKGHSIPLSGLEEHERPLPTIICANVCEKYNDTMRPLPDVSFDMFFK
jgi:hypothetical protein